MYALFVHVYTVYSMGGKQGLQKSGYSFLRKFTVRSDRNLRNNRTSLQWVVWGVYVRKYENYWHGNIWQKQTIWALGDSQRKSQSLYYPSLLLGALFTLPCHTQSMPSSPAMCVRPNLTSSRLGSFSAPHHLSATFACFLCAATCSPLSAASAFA